MPTLRKPARRLPTENDVPTPPPVVRVRVADLKPVDGVAEFAVVVREAAPAADPPRGVVDNPLSSRVVVAGTTVLFGWERVAAARIAGAATIEVEECPGCDGLHPGDLLVKAMGLYYRAGVRHLSLSPFAAGQLAADLYAAWRRNRKRRRQSRARSAKQDEWEALRQRLIRQELGMSVRVLQREVRLLYFRPKLRAAVREGLLPKGHLDLAAGLPACRQDELADRLATGTPFSTLRAEFFGPAGGQKKTVRAAANAIRTSIRRLVTEARGREGVIGLRAEDYPAAREAVQYLSGWLAAPPPQGSVEDHVLAGLGDLLPGPATRGGRGVTGGRR